MRLSTHAPRLRPARTRVTLSASEPSARECPGLPGREYFPLTYLESLPHENRLLAFLGAGTSDVNPFPAAAARNAPAVHASAHEAPRRVRASVAPAIDSSSFERESRRRAAERRELLASLSAYSESVLPFSRPSQRNVSPTRSQPHPLRAAPLYTYSSNRTEAALNARSVTLSRHYSSSSQAVAAAANETDRRYSSTSKELRRSSPAPLLGTREHQSNRLRSKQQPSRWKFDGSERPAKSTSLNASSAASNSARDTSSLSSSASARSARLSRRTLGASTQELTQRSARSTVDALEARIGRSYAAAAQQLDSHSHSQPERFSSLPADTRTKRLRSPSAPRDSATGQRSQAHDSSAAGTAVTRLEEANEKRVDDQIESLILKYRHSKMDDSRSDTGREPTQGPRPVDADPRTRAATATDGVRGEQQSRPVVSDTSKLQPSELGTRTMFVSVNTTPVLRNANGLPAAFESHAQQQLDVPSTQPLLFRAFPSNPLSLFESQGVLSARAASRERMRPVRREAAATPDSRATPRISESMSELVLSADVDRNARAIWADLRHQQRAKAKDAESVSARQQQQSPPPPPVSPGKSILKKSCSLLALERPEGEALELPHVVADRTEPFHLSEPSHTDAEMLPAEACDSAVSLGDQQQREQQQQEKMSALELPTPAHDDFSVCNVRE